MARLRLSTLLVVINVGLLLLAVAGVAVVAVVVFARLSSGFGLCKSLSEVADGRDVVLLEAVHDTSCPVQL